MIHALGEIQRHDDRMATFVWLFGAQRYLTKPVSVTELLAVLDELLEDAETRFG